MLAIVSDHISRRAMVPRGLGKCRKRQRTTVDTQAAAGHCNSVTLPDVMACAADRSGGKCDDNAGGIGRQEKQGGFQALPVRPARGIIPDDCSNPLAVKGDGRLCFMPYAAVEEQAGD